MVSVMSSDIIREAITGDHLALGEHQITLGSVLTLGSRQKRPEYGLFVLLTVQDSSHLLLIITYHQQYRGQIVGFLLRSPTHSRCFCLTYLMIGQSQE